MNTLQSCLSLLLSVLVLPALAAQESSPYQPKLSNSKNGVIHDFPMGVLSATGRLQDGDRAILVLHVGKDGAADRGGLVVGDRIVSIRGQQPSVYSNKPDSGLAGPQTELANALEQACADEPHQLRLAVQRKDENVQLSIAVPTSLAFAESFPTRCPKSEKYLAAIADHLAATQQGDGRWRPGVGGDADVYAAAFCALALLAAQNEAHRPAIKRAIDFIRKKCIASIKPSDPKVGPKNWQAASSAVLLAEYQLATGDDTYFTDLEKCCDLLASRVSESGTMGHHFQIPYDGGGLVIINVQAHLAWALAEKCGYEIDAGAWNRSFKEVRKSIDKPTGAIGYSSRATWSPDISARTGAMATALAVREQEPELVKQFCSALVAHQGRMRHAHSMSSIGLIYGFSGLKLADRESHQLVMQKWKPYLELCRTSAGSAAYLGGKRNFGGDQYLGLPAIGNATVALMLASGRDKLFLHGGAKKDWFKARETKVERRFRARDVYEYDKKILFRSDFAETGFDKLNLSEDGRYSLPNTTPERIEVVDATDSEARKAVRFFVPRAANSYRAEISLPSEKGFQERWYAERMLVPKNWVIDSGKGADIVMQWHAIPGNWRATHPNLNIAIQGENWYVRQHYGDAQDNPVRKNTKLETPLEPGKWIDWVIHARWSPRDDGLIEIWKDGKQVFRFAGPNVYSTIGVEYTPYLKTGIYHPEWNLNDPRKRQAFDQEVSPPAGKTIYVSKLIVGSKAASYKDVAP